MNTESKPLFVCSECQGTAGFIHSGIGIVCMGCQQPARIVNEETVVGHCPIWDHTTTGRARQDDGAVNNYLCQGCNQDFDHEEAYGRDVICTLCGAVNETDFDDGYDVESGDEWRWSYTTGLKESADESK